MTTRPADLVIRARRAVLPTGESPAAVVIADGRVQRILDHDVDVPDVPAIHLGPDTVLLPGLVDTHVHVNEPGRTDWEGFATATRAAAAGGVTTLLDMPLNCVPPTVDRAALQLKRAVATGQVHVDVGFWGGAVPATVSPDADPAVLDDLQAAGTFGVKCFLADSGVPEFPPLDADGLLRLAERAAALDALVAVHAEDAAVLAAAAPAGPGYEAFLASRPVEAEVAAVRTVIEVARRTGARLHVLHLSAADALPDLAAARADGVRVTVETCPHYLVLDSAGVPAGATEFKCCPPVRDADNADRLWAALRDGVIEAVVSDHSPCPVELKRPGGAGDFAAGVDPRGIGDFATAVDPRGIGDFATAVDPRGIGDFATAWGGISSIQLGLPAMWTVAAGRGVALSELVGWMAAGPARIAGLRGKGQLVPGADADLVEFAPDESFVVDPAVLAHRHPITPYAGRRLRGVVRRTWLRGRPTGGAPRGRLLTRPDPAGRSGENAAVRTDR